MPTRPAAGAPHRLSTWLNLLVPGGGLVILGRLRTGLVLGLAFIVSANTALLARLIAPDDVPGWAQNLAIIVACLIYIAAQGLLLGAGQAPERPGLSAAARRTTLAELERLFAGGDYESARRVIDANRALLNADPHIAYRRAQILTELNDPEAPAAWLHLGALDQHGIYRAERLAGLERARTTPPAVPAP